MNEDEIGLRFFTGDNDAAPAASPSVFGSVDQGEIISRIDRVDDDDLDSTFYENSMTDVEDAATRSFDVGIRMVTDDPRHAMGDSMFSSSMETNVPRELPTGPLTSSMLADDDGARRAFILGGPEGMPA